MFKSDSGRLTEAGIAEVHRLRAEGWTYQRIANHLGVCNSTVYNILKGKTHGGR